MTDSPDAPVKSRRKSTAGADAQASPETAPKRTRAVKAEASAPESAPPAAKRARSVKSAEPAAEEQPKRPRKAAASDGAPSGASASAPAPASEAPRPQRQIPVDETARQAFSGRDPEQDARGRKRSRRGGRGRGRNDGPPMNDIQPNRGPGPGPGPAPGNHAGAPDRGRGPARGPADRGPGRGPGQGGYGQGGPGRGPGGGGGYGGYGDRGRGPGPGGGYGPGGGGGGYGPGRGPGGPGGRPGGPGRNEGYGGRGNDGYARGGGPGGPSGGGGDYNRPIDRSVPKNQLPQDLIYGINAVSVALELGQLRALYYDNGFNNERVKQIHAHAQDAGLTVMPLSRQGWSRALSADQHQGVAGMLFPQQNHFLEEIVANAGEDSCVLVLDRVQDPMNLGAILRTAGATGVDAVVLPKAGGCPVTPAVHRASAGLSLVNRIVEDENIARALETLKDNGYWVIGCDSEEGEDATTFEFPHKRVIVMGNEAEGMRRLVKESCDYLVRIPMPGPKWLNAEHAGMTSGAVESLNVSVATAIVLYLAMSDLARAHHDAAPEAAPESTPEPSPEPVSS